MENSNYSAASANIGPIGWKYYNTIRNKAMEQEFSWSGLVLSLSIAFFIVAISAISLNLLYFSIKTAHAKEQLMNEKTEIIQEFNNIC